MKTKLNIRYGAGLALLLFSAACDGLLSVPDPQRYTSEDLDDALQAVANGVEGQMHAIVDSWVVYQALLGDEYQHTGTWSGYDETDHGRFQYGNQPMAGHQNTWLRTQWYAVDAEARFKRVMGDAEASNAPITAQVQLAGGLADLLNGMTFCESVAEPTGNAVTDMQLLKQAEMKLTTAMATAQTAGRVDYHRAAQAGRAEARMLMGDWSGAASDASAIPAEFSYDAIFNATSTNSVVQLTTKQNNEAAGLLHKWWPLIEKSDDPGFMKDEFSGMPDMRIPVYFDGEVATDNETPHYSQWKYNDDQDDIPLLHSDLMRLIEAEAAAMGGDFETATGLLNDLRAAVDLPTYQTPTSAADMDALILHERFAELFMGGRRIVDLHRKGIVKQVFDALEDDEREGSGRPTKWPMTSTEPTYNPNVDDDLTKRCLPKTS